MWCQQEVVLSQDKAETTPAPMSMKVDGRYIHRMDALVPVLAAKHPGLRVTRADVLRMVLRRGLTAVAIELGYNEEVSDVS